MEGDKDIHFADASQTGTEEYMHGSLSIAKYCPCLCEPTLIRASCTSPHLAILVQMIAVRSILPALDALVIALT